MTQNQHFEYKQAEKIMAKTRLGKTIRISPDVWVIFNVLQVNDLHTYIFQYFRKVKIEK